METVPKGAVFMGPEHTNTKHHSAEIIVNVVVVKVSIKKSQTNKRPIYSPQNHW